MDQYDWKFFLHEFNQNWLKYITHSNVPLESLKKLLQKTWFGYPGASEEQMIYPKLKMSNVNNFYERKADRIADQVMTKPHKTTEESPLIQRKAEEEDDFKNEINRSPNFNQLSESEVSSDVESNIRSMKSGGQFLAESEKSFFKPGFGGIVNRVKIHNDSTAHETARAINARAFTMGDGILSKGSQGNNKKRNKTIIDYGAEK